jgi:hypothetical protein
MKTRDEVEALKANWLRDPCYNIEDIEGYEEYGVELAAFAVEHQAIWRAAREKVEREAYRNTPASEATLRDVFAMHALTGMGYTLALFGQEMDTLAKVAATAYRAADAMMEARRVPA